MTESLDNGAVKIIEIMGLSTTGFEDALDQAVAKAAESINGITSLEVTHQTATVKDGKVAEFGMEARACALGQAAASIVARNIVGAGAKELYRLRDEMRAMLKGGAPAPTGTRWAALAALGAIRDYPQRHASTLLVFEAVADCLDQISAAAKHP